VVEDCSALEKQKDHLKNNNGNIKWEPMRTKQTARMSTRPTIKPMHSPCHTCGISSIIHWKKKCGVCGDRTMTFHKNQKNKGKEQCSKCKKFFHHFTKHVCDGDDDGSDEENGSNSDD